MVQFYNLNGIEEHLTLPIIKNGSNKKEIRIRPPIVKV